jgi:hypothetical protein
LIGFSDSDEDVLQIAALMPGMTRSVVIWGAGGLLRDSDGHLREAM